MPIITNNIRKTTASLSDVKYRRKLGLFKAEGTKCVTDTINYFDLHSLFATESWLNTHSINIPNNKIYIVNHADLKEMSAMVTVPDVIAVYHIPEVKFRPETLTKQLVIALDDIQDPGNLGTIIRSADWFGIHNILCSKGCVDVYNPKTIQATMGAISRVNLYYGDLFQMIQSINPNNIYGTFLSGISIYDTELSTEGVIIMGNEGKGISDSIAALVNKKIFIPSYPIGSPTGESLNVATATAITIAEFRRKI